MLSADIESLQAWLGDWTYVVIDQASMCDFDETNGKRP